MTPISYCTFVVRGACCGVPIDRIREIVSDQAITPVPRAHRAVRGLINLRGQILTVVDVGRWIRMSPHQLESPGQPVPRFHLIADVGREMISMCVDEMGPVLSPSSDELEPIPANVDQEAAGLITAAARMPEGLVLLLDLDRMGHMKGAAVNRPAETRPRDENLERTP
jgi:purine-binding chemotaxis protein CheW